MNSGWTRRSAFRRTRSARRVRTGDFRSTDGTCSPSGISTGCATARTVTRICSTATATVIWWEDAPHEEREAVLAIPSVRALLTPEDLASVDAPGLPHAIHEALLETLFAAGSSTLILPIQDIFGWRDRINQPATVGDGN